MKWATIKSVFWKNMLYISCKSFQFMLPLFLFLMFSLRFFVHFIFVVEQKKKTTKKRVSKCHDHRTSNRSLCVLYISLCPHMLSPVFAWIQKRRTQNEIEVIHIKLDGTDRRPKRIYNTRGMCLCDILCLSTYTLLRFSTILLYYEHRYSMLYQSIQRAPNMRTNKATKKMWSNYRRAMRNGAKKRNRDRKTIYRYWYRQCYAHTINSWKAKNCSLCMCVCISFCAWKESIYICHKQVYC